MAGTASEDHLLPYALYTGCARRHSRSRGQHGRARKEREGEPELDGCRQTLNLGGGSRRSATVRRWDMAWSWRWIPAPPAFFTRLRMHNSVRAYEGSGTIEEAKTSSRKHPDEGGTTPLPRARGADIGGILETEVTSTRGTGLREGEG